MHALYVVILLTVVPATSTMSSPLPPSPLFPPSPPAPLSPSDDDDWMQENLVLIVAVVGAFAVVVSFIVACVYLTLRPRSEAPTTGQVGAQVGFDDPYHFSRVFKRVNGLSPKRYATFIKRGSLPSHQARSA